MGGGADIGAFEIQLTDVPQLPGDYNGNQTVDAADYVIWRKTLGLQVNRYQGADGNGNNSIDADDFSVWRSNFGRSLGGASIIAPSAVDEIVGAQPLEMNVPALSHVATVAVDRPNSDRGDIPAEPCRHSPTNADIELVVALLAIEAVAAAEASHFSPASSTADEIDDDSPESRLSADVTALRLLDTLWTEWPRALERF